MAVREGRFRPRYKEEIFYHEGGETLEQVARRGSGGPIPGHIQGQVGWGSEQELKMSLLTAGGSG